MTIPANTTSISTQFQIIIGRSADAIGTTDSFVQFIASRSGMEVDSVQPANEYLG